MTARTSHRRHGDGGPATRTPVRVAATPAMGKGLAFASQCGGCGTLVYVPLPPATQGLGACPACSRTDWWPLALPVGPFISSTDDSH